MNVVTLMMTKALLVWGSFIQGVSGGCFYTSPLWSSFCEESFFFCGLYRLWTRMLVHLVSPHSQAAERGLHLVQLAANQCNHKLKNLFFFPPFPRKCELFKGEPLKRHLRINMAKSSSQRFFLPPSMQGMKKKKIMEVCIWMGIK